MAVADAAPDPLYTVNRSQDGARVRAELDLATARDECAVLNAQARQQVGLAGAHAVFGSMYRGEVSRFEVRSADGLVIA